MDLSYKKKAGVCLSVLFSLSALALAATVPPLANWTAPATYKPGSSSKIHALTDISNPVPFIATAPCRQANSLLSTPLLQGVNRVVPLTGAPCNIPATAVAVSVNITVFNIAGATGNGVFKVDTISPPLSAWINYPPTETQRANAGAVALNGSGQIIVQVAQGAGQVDFIVDTNGYYGATPATATDPFVVNSAAGSSSAAIIGNNSSTATFASGVLGQMTSTGSGSSSAGVRGVNNGTGSSGFGVLGSHDGSGYGVFGLTASGVGVYGSCFGSGTGVFGESNGGIGVSGITYASTGKTPGVQGLAGSTTGTVYGVRGNSFSTSDGSAGVIGIAQGTTGGTPTFLPTGVRGESTTGNGIVGLVNPGSGNSGVAGFLYDTTGVQLAAGRLGYAAGPIGVSYSGGLGGSGTKSFFEPHPTDATKMIRYISIEGPEAGVYFRGTSTTVDGFATIPVPETFRIVTDEEGLTVQLTPTGRQFAMMTVQSADLNTIVVRSSKDVTFHYLVQGVRRAYKDVEVVTRNFHFIPESPDAKMPASLSAVERRRMIENGTYNPDGTVNMSTAERAGWAADWKKQAEEAAIRPADQVKAVGIGPPTRN